MSPDARGQDGTRWHPSGNFGPRRGGAVPDTVVIHYTAMDSCAAALERLCDPHAEVSAHYLIGADGLTYQLVEEGARAWHAGAGRWGDAEDLNSRSIGIELDNRGDTPFAAPQMDALEALLQGIVGRWRIAAPRVIGHSDLAPGRKCDPGPRFDWRRLALRGLAVWPQGAGRAGPGPVLNAADTDALFAALAAFGYDAGADRGAVLAAFRARFRPQLRSADDPPPDTCDLALARDLSCRFPVDRAARCA
ncbi:N-acetylmuramoyl-L-alanine amidase [Brevirhabdus sp.]|uniref:N-acetylmuramoyl-L-alanine amidase n=1 Tax=Brevirhabdus sp. TaxID=2004514 RepID=UPI0040598E36